MSAEVVQPAPFYGLELIDVLTGGPLVGDSAVDELSSGIEPFLVNRSRWVFENLPAAPATFVITTRFYVEMSFTTGGGIPNPPASGAGYLVTVPMMPRTGYPFPPTLTRVVGLVRLNALVDPQSPTVVGATVTVTPGHYDATTGTTTYDSPVPLTTTDDGQYAYWFLPVLTQTPAIANVINVQATDGSHHASAGPISLVPNGVTYAPTMYLS